MEDEVIADIARRIKATGRYTETAELMAKSMIEQGYSAEKIQVEVMKTLRADKSYQMVIAENTKKTKQEIQDIIEKTVKKAKVQGNDLVANAGNMAWNNDLSMWEQHGINLKKPNSLSQLIKATQRQTINELKNLTRTMGFKNTHLGIIGVKAVYQRELDLALLKISTGTFSFDAAVDDCIHRLAQSGLRSVDYASGRTYQLDTAARMCVRTGLSQLSGKIMEENLKSSGQDLVITSQHMGSRPEHAVWQNRVFSYSGKSKKYPDFFKATGYGTVTGLKGANCTHDFYPYWEGASVIPEDIKEPEAKVINGKKYTYYQMTQQQRKIERKIRATKREIEAQNLIGGDVAILKKNLSRQMEQYVSFCDKAELRPKKNRLRVIAGTSKTSIRRIKVADKNSKSKTIDNASKNGIILSTDEVIGIAKQFGAGILQDKDKLIFDDGNPIYNYVARKLKYDALPKVVDKASFTEMAKDSPVGIIYRGITANTQEKAKQYAEAFMYGKMFAGKSYAYGSGTYFSPDKSEAEKYNNQGVMLKSTLSKDAKIVKYNNIVKEYSSTGADVARMKKGDNTEAWEDILKSVGEFAAIKGYDAIDMDGALGQKHIIVLNRGKVIIEK